MATSKVNSDSIALSEGLILSPPKQAKDSPCMSTNTLFAISTVVGAILLILGSVVLASQFTPTSGNFFYEAMQKVHTFSQMVATKIGSDLFQLSIFTTSFGLAFTATGTVGLIVNRCRQPASKQGVEIDYDRIGEMEDFIDFIGEV